MRVIPAEGDPAVGDPTLGHVGLCSHCTRQRDGLLHHGTKLGTLAARMWSVPAGPQQLGSEGCPKAGEE